MNSKSVYKVPNGKLLKIFININIKKKKINKINIAGDFFVHPEESIEIIEESLKNVKLEKDLITEKISSVAREKKIVFIGINSENIAEGILRCLK
jgi:hypothetical protein